MLVHVNLRLLPPVGTAALPPGLQNPVAEAHKERSFVITGVISTNVNMDMNPRM